MCTNDKPLIISGRLSALPKNHFQNLARKLENPNEPTEADKQIIEAVSTQITNELSIAGIKIHKFGSIISRGEVPSRVIGDLSMWSFKRAWYYYIAEGPGLPVEIAEELYKKHPHDVRVDGHAACPSPREWFKGFGVGHYHVDTQEGLTALAEALKSVYIEE